MPECRYFVRHGRLQGAGRGLMGKILPPETARPKKSGQTWRGLAAGSQPGGVAGEGVFITVCSVMALPSEIVGQFSVFPRVDHIQAQIHKIPAVARDHAQAMLHCGCPKGRSIAGSGRPAAAPIRPQRSATWASTGKMVPAKKWSPACEKTIRPPWHQGSCGAARTRRWGRADKLK